MTYDPRKTPAYTLPDQRSDYEEALIPNRSETITATAVEFPNNQMQQGVVATSSDKPVFARRRSGSHRLCAMVVRLPRVHKPCLRVGRTSGAGQGQVSNAPF